MNSTLRRNCFLLCLLMLFLLSSCVKKEEETQTLLDPVTRKTGTVTVTRGDYTFVDVYDAFVVPEIEIITSPMAGVIARIPYVSGDYVEKGALILRFDTAREEAEKAAILADREYESSLYEIDDRTYTLKKQYIETQISLSYQQGAGWQSIELLRCDLAELELDREKAVSDREKRTSEQEKRLAELDNVIALSSLYAPVSGRIYYAGTMSDGKKTVKEGESAAPDDELAFIMDENRLHIEMEERMPQSLQELPYYALIGGERCDVTYVPRTAAEAASDRLLKRLPKTVFRLKNAPENLKSGMYAPIVFETAVYEDVLLVPAAAVIRDPDLSRDFVYVMDESGGHTRRDVQIVTDSVKAVILSGLSEGEVLYVDE